MPGKFLIINWPSTKEVTTCKHEIINGLVSNFFNSTACLVFAHCYLPSVYVCPDLLNVAYKLGNIPGGGGVLPRILDRGVPRRFVDPNPI